MKFVVCVCMVQIKSGGVVNIQSCMFELRDMNSAEEALGEAIKQAQQSKPKHQYNHHTILEIK